MQTIIGFILRVGVSLAVVWAVAFFVVVLPHDQALEQIKQQAKSIEAVQTALTKGQELLSSLPDPKSIAPQTKDAARNYTQKISSAIPVFNMQAPSKLPAFTPIWSEEKITKYNTVANDTKFINALDQAKASLQGGEAFFNHHYAVMKALANLLEYNPAQDTSYTNNDAIIGAMEAAGSGLATTLKRLDDAPKYSDPTLDGVKKKVKDLDAAREAYYKALKSGQGWSSQKAAFIAAVTNAQTSLIADRQAFWSASVVGHLHALGQAQKELQGFAGRF
jgi:hypothetical protein